MSLRVGIVCDDGSYRFWEWDTEKREYIEMPWTPKEFASRHNHKLKGASAAKAASMANAMLRSGVPEGEAIAVANKRAKGVVKKKAKA